MSTSKYLALIASAIETLAGASTTANQTAGGYWKRIAAAAESVNGASSSATAFLTGYMKRAAVTIADYTNFAGNSYNSNEEGYLAWMVAALESFTGSTTTGSSESRLVTLLGTAATFSILLLEDGFSFLLEDNGELQLG